MGKDNDKRQTQINIPICLACVLLCLTLISIHMTGNMYARYTSAGQGSDITNVAKFNVSAVKTNFNETGTIDLTKATTTQSVSWSFTVTSNSQVASTDKVTVTLPKALPEGVSMTMKVGTTQLSGVTTDQKVYTYTRDFSSGNYTHNWVLTFACEPGSFTETLTFEDINIDVDVVQKD